MDVINVILGVFFGLFISLVPGFHINTLAPFSTSPEFLAAAAGSYLIFSLFQAFIFLLMIPSEIASLPFILKLLIKEKREKIFLVHSLGVIGAMLLALLLYEKGLYSISYTLLTPYLKYILLLAAIILIAKSKNKWGYAIILLSAGLIGEVGFKYLNDNAYLPLFVGLFSLPYLLNNNYKKAKIEGKRENLPLNWKSLLAAVIVSSLLAFIAVLLPGISSASVVGTVFLPFKPSPLPYISMLGGITSAQYIYSLYSWEEFHKSRIGWVKYMPAHSIQYSAVLLLGAFLAVGIGVFILKTAKFNLPHYIKYLIFVYLIAAIYLQSGLAGLLFLTLSVIIGYVAIKADVERTSLLGSILLPTLLLLWKIFL